MRTTPILLFLAMLTACALEGRDDDVVVVIEPDAGSSGVDASVPTPDAAPCPDATPPPDAPPEIHEIYCAPDGDYFSTRVEFRGNLKTGLVDPAPSWTPGYIGYGADYRGYGWPVGGVANPASDIGDVAVQADGTWKADPATFDMFNYDTLSYVQGITPYIASGGQVKWILMDKWTIPPGQYCIKSPSGTKLCECWATPCDLSTTYPGCEN